MATRFVLDSGLQREWQVTHLDTTDRRGLDNVGRVDAANVVLAMKHATGLLRLLATARPDVVYVPIAQNTLGLLRDATFVLPALAAGRRVVLHVHGSGLRAYHDAAGPVMRRLLGAMLAGARRVIVLGERLRPMLDGLVDGDRVAVLPNGSDDPFGGVPDRSSRTGPVRVLYLGNLIRTKGFLDVMDAVGMLRGKGLPVELHLAGDFLSDVDRRAAADRGAGLGTAVTFHGVVTGDAKTELLRSADIFCFPSYYPNEGHPYVVVEAMAAGLPVVATAHATIGDTVLDGETGILVPPRNPEALATALASLVKAAGERSRLGHAGRRRFEDHYTLVRWSDGLCRIMRESLT
ncbi:MAG TPA: glycosyltransferase family 4 protein [Longimicrobiales bacterium]|nr:glycosyltransferase family 4 protein [Longimicrobiales bacterium]